MRSIADYLALMDHAIGITPAAGHVLLDSFNDAGRALYSAHPWRWLQAGPITIPSVAGQDYLELPADFGTCDHAFIDRNQASGPYDRVEQVSSADIMSLKSHLLEWRETGVLYLAFPGSIDQPAADAEPVQRALVYPTFPDASTIVSLSYTRAWVDQTDASETKFPPIHREWEQALAHQARLTALKIEQMAEQAALEQQCLDAELRRLIMRDGRRQRSVGRLSGGADRFMTRQSADIRVAPVAL